VRADSKSVGESPSIKKTESRQKVQNRDEGEEAVFLYSAEKRSPPEPKNAAPFSTSQRDKSSRSGISRLSRPDPLMRARSVLGVFRTGPTAL
jgi:hypothetical protein